MKILKFLGIQPNHEIIFSIRITIQAFPLLKALGSSLETWLMQTLPSLPEGIQRLLIRSHLRWWSSRWVQLHSIIMIVYPWSYPLSWIRSWIKFLPWSCTVFVQSAIRDRIVFEAFFRLNANGSVEKQHEYKQKMVKIFRENEAIAEATEEAKEQHYEVPTEFFKLTLGRWLKYSSCYWPQSCQSLDQSEVEMLELICERAQMEDGLEVLDLGCGWGSCGLYLLNKYPNIKVTFFSNSKTQQVSPLVTNTKHDQSFWSIINNCFLGIYSRRSSKRWKQFKDQKYCRWCECDPNHWSKNRSGKIDRLWYFV